ncbi:MAG: hypothetical protein IJ686_02845 [Bacteroidales bacterium]|nr:hypothetical protein [Bacteroidales bacterium]
MTEKNIFLTAAFGFSLLLSLSSCEWSEPGQEEGGTEKDPVPVTLTLSSTVQSRTVLGDLVDGVYRVFWSNGDRICVNGVKSDALYGLADSTVNASFTIKGVTPPYSVVYPSINCDAISESGVADISIPVSQKYTAGSFPEGSAMLYGNTESESASLKNLCGVVKIPVTAYRASKLKSVELISKSVSDPLAGKFNLNTRTGELAAVSGTSTLLLSLPVEGVDLAPGDTVSLMMAVHSGEYASGFNIRLTDTQDRTMIVEWTESTAVEAGVIAGLPAIEFDPSTALEITDIESWELFAAAANAGDWSEWANKNGEVNLLGNISVAGDITPIESWNGIFKGNGFTISRGNACNPIFKTIEAGAVVKDLVVAGRCTELPGEDHQYGLYDVSYANFVCPLSVTNYGTISNCTSRVEVSLNGRDEIFYLGGMVMYNAGLMEDCSNEGPITVNYVVTNRRWASIGGLACFASDGVASHSVSLHNYRNIESAGTFVNCSNKADILVTKRSNSTTGGTHYLSGFDLGGICASVNAGTAEHPARFENCTNSGKISFLEYEIGSTTQYKYAYGLGGIVGCVGNHTPLWKYGGSEVTAAFYEIPSDYASKLTDTTPAGYAFEIVNCSNTADLESAARVGNDLASSITATEIKNPRKQGYFGGIIGYCYGASDYANKIEGCSNTGAMHFSERYMGNAGGGIAGAAANVSFKNCTVNIGQDKKVAPSVQPDWYVPAKAGSNYRAAGSFGGIFGIAHADVTIESCKSFIYIDYPLTPSADGLMTASYVRFPGFLFAVAFPETTVRISGTCGLGGHIMSYFYNPGTKDLDKKFINEDIDRDNVSSFICYRDVYDNRYKDMWVEAGHTTGNVVISDSNFGTVTGKENVAYWDGK